MNTHRITLAVGNIDEIAERWMREAGARCEYAMDFSITLIQLPEGSTVNKGEYIDYHYVELPGERILAYKLYADASQSNLEAYTETHLRILLIDEAQQGQHLAWLLQVLPSATVTDQADSSKLVDISVWELYKAGKDVERIGALLEERGLDYTIKDIRQ